MNPVVDCIKKHPRRASAARGVERCGCGDSRMGEPGWYERHLAQMIGNTLINGTSIEAAASILFGDYRSEYSASAEGMSWRDFSDQAQAVLQAALAPATVQ